MTIRVAALAVMMVMVPATAYAQHDGYVAPIQPTPEMLRKHLIEELSAIRQDGLQQRAEDGGVLTAAHRTVLQAKINAAKTRYVSQRRQLGLAVASVR